MSDTYGDPATDPIGTVRDVGTPFADKSSELAQINRYFIRWSPPLCDEERPWVALNHEADLQRMPDDLMAAYPVVPLADLARRLRHTDAAIEV